jgi:RNA polymerase sigma-70 factor, ECF subfamily
LEPEDQEIIQRIKNGETSAYKLLVQKYHRHLLNFIFRIVRDEFIVEDIGQEVFISIYRSLNDFDESRGVPFSAWLFIVARNRCISELRKKKTAEFVPIFDDFPAPNPSQAADDSLIFKEQRIAIEKALEKLEEPFRTTLLQSLMGASINDIAKTCSLPESTVKTRLFRARQKLKKLFHLSAERRLI